MQSQRWIDRRLNPALVLIGSGLLFGVCRLGFGQAPAAISGANSTNDDRWHMLCGSRGMLTDVSQIPSVGCFRLSRGHKAAGNFGGRLVTVRVDARGESCEVGGTAFNCSGCIDTAHAACGAMLTLHSRDADGFVNFYVSRKVAENTYVTNQENLDLEQERMQSRVDMPAKTAATGGRVIPDGPYASWPAESRQKAVGTLMFRCAMLSTMELANYRGPNEAGQEMAQALSMACVDHQMPDDWPGHANLQTKEAEHLEKAEQLDPSISDIWRVVQQPQPNGAAGAVKP
jgi:hypothetical protein